MTRWTARVDWTREAEPSPGDLGGWLDDLADHSPAISIQRDRMEVLIGFAEIADLVGVSTQRARQLADVAGFPPAVVETHGWPLRVKSQVVAWLSEWEGKTGHPRLGTGSLLPVPRRGG